MKSLRFTQSDLTAFRDASHDFNPLHTSPTYARKTVYGEPVVFGILGTLAALGRLRERPDEELASITLEFMNPLFVGVDYSVEAKEKDADQATIKIFDAGRPIMAGTVTFRSSEASSQELTEANTSYSTEAEEWSTETLKEGCTVAGTYAPSVPSLALLRDRWKLASKGVAPIQLAALLWSSYLVGMRLPGRQATFAWLTLEFPPSEPAWQTPLAYEAGVARFDDRVDLLEIGASLRSGESTVGTARIGAFVRSMSPSSSLETLEGLLARSEQLQGKVALVIGGSRGLGAAISQALALQGCTVFVTYQHSTAEAETVREQTRHTPGHVELLQGDAADEAWCHDVLQVLIERHGGLDILICNASPPIRPLSFAPGSLDRFHHFVDTSVALVSVPMAVFLSTVSERSGWVAVISSIFVRTTPVEWPHYVTAKAAVEGLVSWAAPHYKRIRFVLVRPPKLLTDQTNTPFGRRGTMGVEQVAAGIVASFLADGPSNARAHLLESF